MTTGPPLHRCFAPIVDANTRVIILGSLPGAASLAAGRYYAHPRNQFWRLLGAVMEEPLETLPYDAKLEALLVRGIGLWDMVAAARRRGSLDAAIRVHAASDLLALAKTLPELAAIAFNGGTAARIGRRQIGASMPWTLIELPSSSPAFTLPVAAKLETWRSLWPYLGP